MRKCKGELIELLNALRWIIKKYFFRWKSFFFNNLEREKYDPSHFHNNGRYDV